MFETLNNWDQQLMLLLNNDGGAFLDQFWYIYSGKFTWIPLYLLLLWLMIDRCRKNTKLVFWQHLALCIFCTVMLIIISDQVASGIIKPLVCRPRPSHEPGLMEMLHYVNDYHGGQYGFVSSHASNSLAIVLWLGWFIWGQASETFSQTETKWGRTFRLALIIWAILNCYSRIYLGVHYPGDIIGGLFIGWAAFIIIRWAYCKITQKIKID